MAHVSAFCSFQSFMKGNQGVGCLRYKIGRQSNEDAMIVGLPVVFKVSTNRGADLVTTTIEFATCHINGLFGTVTPPHLSHGMLTEDVHFSCVVEQAKMLLPVSHSLASKGWKKLPRGEHTLPAHIAVPA